MSDQTEAEAHAKRGLAEAEDEVDAKRSKIEPQVPPTEAEEDIEARLLREWEEEEKKEEEAAAELAKLEEKRQSELKEQAQQAKRLNPTEADPIAHSQAEVQSHDVHGQCPTEKKFEQGALALEKLEEEHLSKLEEQVQQAELQTATEADQSDRSKAEPKTHDVQRQCNTDGASEQSAAGLAKLEEMPPSELEEKAQQVEPKNAADLDRSAHSNAKLETHNVQAQCGADGTFKFFSQVHDGPSAVLEPPLPVAEERPSSELDEKAQKVEPKNAADLGQSAHSNAKLETHNVQGQGSTEGTFNSLGQVHDGPRVVLEPPLLVAETTATSADRAAEWTSSVDALVDAHSLDTKVDAHSLDAKVEDQGKKPEGDTAGALPKKVVLRFNGHCAPKIIGRAANSINKVREASGATIKTKKEPDLCEITISASNPSRVQKAKQMVIELAGEQPHP